MKQGRPSQTAAWVALARSLGWRLPKHHQLAYDPYGIAFVRGPLRAAGDLLLQQPLLLDTLLSRVPSAHAFVLWLQLRTRAFDDVLLEFIAAGGKQVVLLGAGYDCRAVRYAHLLDHVQLFEVDHPDTQAHKLSTMQRHALRSPARYVAWDFERQGLTGLAAQLSREGLVREQRVLTVWEGVTMYLSEQAIEETLATVRGYGAPGSWLAFNYVDRRVVGTPRGDQRITQLLARVSGEPHRFGWEPSALPAWLQARGYQLQWDATDRALAERWLTSDAAAHFAASNRHIVLARS